MASVSHRFRCHLCTTHLPCMFMKSAPLPRERDSDGNVTPEESHPVRTWGCNYFKRRSTVDWPWAEFFFCFLKMYSALNYTLKTALIEWSKEGLSFTHVSKDSHLKTRSGELSGFLLIHSTVFKCFVMCNILYYRFAVLAQFFKFLFSFFYNLKKKIDVIFFFLLSKVAVFFFFM